MTATEALVTARNSGAPFDAIAQFDAAVAPPDAAQGARPMATLWAILSAQLAALKASRAVDTGALPGTIVYWQYTCRNSLCLGDPVNGQG